MFLYDKYEKETATVEAINCYFMKKKFCKYFLVYPRKMRQLLSLYIKFKSGDTFHGFYTTSSRTGPFEVRSNPHNYVLSEFKQIN